MDRGLESREKKQTQATQSEKGVREIRSTPARLGLKGRGPKRHVNDGGNDIESCWPCRIYAARHVFKGRKPTVKADEHHDLSSM